MDAAWYRGQVGEAGVWISALQTKRMSWLAVHHPVNHILTRCSFKLQSHGRNVITFDIVVATQRVCVEAWKQARNLLPSSPPKPSPAHLRPLVGPSSPTPHSYSCGQFWKVRWKQSQLLWWTILTSKKKKRLEMFTVAVPGTRWMAWVVFAVCSSALNKVVPCYAKLQASVLHSH